MARIQVIVDQELHRAFKAKCAAEGKEMSDILRELVQEYVKKEGTGNGEQATGNIGTRHI